MFRRRTFLEHHLRWNVYPPLSPDFVEVAERAINLANEGRLRAVVALPDGEAATVLELLDVLQLEAFVDNFDEAA